MGTAKKRVYAPKAKKTEKKEINHHYRISQKAQIHNTMLKQNSKRFS